MLAKMWRNWNTSALVVRMKYGAAAVENGLVVLQKVKNTITVQSRNFTPRYMLRITENKDLETCTSVFMAAPFMLSEKRQQPKSPSTDEQISKM